MMTISITLIMFMVLFLSIPWFVHISMIKDDGVYYGWAGYKQFKRELNKVPWNYDECWERSLFNSREGGYLHADIFKFNNRGMIIHNPIGFYLCKIEIRKYIKNNFRSKITKNIIDWK